MFALDMAASKQLVVLPIDGIEQVSKCASCPRESPGVFCDLPYPLSRDFARAAHIRRVPGGEILLREGESPTGIFIVCRGRVKLSIGSGNDNGVILRMAEPGSVLGLNSVVSGNPTGLTASTVFPSTLDFISRVDFLKLLRLYPELWMRVAQQLSMYCDTVCQRIRAIRLPQSAAEKLARLLAQWSATTGGNFAETVMIPVRTHEDLGRMVGITRETVSRLLGEFRRHNIVDVKGSHLRVIDPEALKRLCENQTSL